MTLRRTFMLAGVALPLASAALARRHGAPRTQAIDLVVIHSTGGPTCDTQTGRPIWVKAGTMDDNIRHIEAHPTLGIHYMIDREGTVRASVPEDQVAHHVLAHSKRSIAIELINDGDGIDVFPEPQLAALVSLLRDIVARRGLQRSAIVRHSDLDRAMLPCDPSRRQRRKVDPGAAYPHEAVLNSVFRRP